MRGCTIAQERRDHGIVTDRCPTTTGHHNWYRAGIVHSKSIPIIDLLMGIDQSLSDRSQDINVIG
jgi:hypothetical protein